MGLVQSLLKSVGSSLRLRWKWDRFHGAECWESFALSACRLRLTTIAAELVSRSNHPSWNEPGDQEAGVAFRFTLGAWWVFGFLFKDEEFYHNWVRDFFNYISVCTVQCLSGSSVHWNSVCYFSIFLNSQPRCWFEKTLLKTGIKY